MASGKAKSHRALFLWPWSFWVWKHRLRNEEEEGERKGGYRVTCLARAWLNEREREGEINVGPAQREEKERAREEKKGGAWGCVGREGEEEAKWPADWDEEMGLD